MQLSYAVYEEHEVYFDIQPFPLLFETQPVIQVLQLVVVNEVTPIVNVHVLVLQ